jgi:hypothetical protein
MRHRLVDTARASIPAPPTVDLAEDQISRRDADSSRSPTFGSTARPAATADGRVKGLMQNRTTVHPELSEINERPGPIEHFAR